MEIDGTLVVGLLVARCKNFDSAKRYFKWSGKASLEQQLSEEFITQMLLVIDGCFTCCFLERKGELFEKLKVLKAGTVCYYLK